MTKLVRLTVFLAASVPAAAPTDRPALNKFAREYNKYVMTLEGGIIDVGQWKKVQKEWERLR